MKRRLQRVRRLKPTDTAKRERLLEALKGDPNEYFQIGILPYSVSDISERLEVDPSNLRKDLLRLELEGFTVSEYRKVEVMNTISMQHMPESVCAFGMLPQWSRTELPAKSGRTV